MTLVPKNLHEIWKNIEGYVHRTISGVYFKFDTNHGQKIIGLVKGSSLDQIEDTKKILTKTFGLRIEKNGGRHGVGGQCLAQVRLDLLKDADIFRINEVLNAPIPSKEKTSTTKKVGPTQNEPQIEEQQPVTLTPKEKAYRISISRLIQSVFDFEGGGGKFRYTNAKKGDICETIEADSTETAEKIFQILQWKIGEKFVTKEEKIVIIDCCDLGHNTSKFNFCFPPKSDDLFDIETRLHRVWTGSKPFVRLLSAEENHWEIRYQRKASESNPKMLNTLHEMGWNVLGGVDKLSIVLGIPKQNEEVVPPTTVESPKVKSEVSKEESRVDEHSTLEQELRNLLNDPLLEDGVHQEILTYFHKEEVNKRAKALLVQLKKS